MQASDGNFYGTTRAGGIDYNSNTTCSLSGCGVLFKLTADGTASGVYHFGASPTDGNWPSGRLIQSRDGSLYGTTAFGGRYGGGSIFKITLGGTYTVLYSFGSTPTDGAVPTSGVIEAADGNFYGTTTSGGANHCNQIPTSGGNCGTVFRMTPSGEVTILHSFGANPSDGVQPEAPLLQASDGNFYGTTVNGGANICTLLINGINGCGAVFKMTPSGDVTTIYSFGETPDAPIAPQGPLIQGRDGALYGTTVSGGGGRCGGYFGCGTVYRMSMAGTVSILHRFSVTAPAGAEGPRNDGYGPSPYLIQASDGNFYGTTGSGGAIGGGADLAGTIFRLTPSGQKTILFSFDPTDLPSNPVAGLIEARDGSLYGLTAYGSYFVRDGWTHRGSGTVYRLSIR